MIPFFEGVPTSGVVVTVLAVVVAYTELCRRSLSIGFLGVFVGFLTFYDLFEAASGPMGVTLLDLLYVTMVVSYLVWKVREDRVVRIPRVAGVLVATGLLLVISSGLPLVAAVTGSAGFMAVTPGLRQAQWLLFVPLAMDLALADELDQREVLTALGVVVVAHAVYGAFQLADLYGPLSTLPHDRYMPTYYRVTGLFLNPNHYGIVMALVVQTILALHWTDRVQRRDLVLAGVATYGIFVSESRTALLVMVASIGGYLLVSGPSARRTAVGYAAMSLPLAVVLELIPGFSVVDRVATVTNLLMGNLTAIDSLAIKFEAWNRAIAVYTQDGATLVAPSTELGIAIDNAYLTMFVQAGPVGPLILTAVYLLLFKYGVNHFRTSRTNGFALALALCTSSIAVASLVMDLHAYAYVVVFLAVLLGLVPAATDATGTDRRELFYIRR